MDRFVAPQFIDVEDRIIGPITTRQFIIMVIGGVVVFVAYKILDTAGFILVTLATLLMVIIFGFVKINGRRFHEFVGSMVEAIKRPKVRVWYKSVPMSAVVAENRNKQVDALKTDFIPRKSIKPKKLKDLALIVDTGGRYQG
ncbi:hypothetical protein A3B87_00310 [Candidatus Kuenenbacteria bacterium RIFCSPHIGHO2_02_FULL_39_13]|uniref:PrgI family protein n=1 Tax=Candidatus Kuenenbacteria bacterium RIFCSPHIGHO2_02_FULL_39_13 TaxID=1798561 RepID=A0A1F6FMP4_9BACT|nr:MAG: hypothetical protein A3B87_00310 [Candidatus Kuenenbacteria bacterium RIFCSPHIGHO2_02_FULL_39_13]